MKWIILASLTISAAFAQSPRFESTRLFVKVAKGAKLPESSLIQSAKPLFGQNYLVKTSNAVALENELKNNKQVVKTERSYYAGKRKLPTAQKTKSMDSSSFFEAFNDPKASKVWAFRDASRKGVSVNKAYMDPLAINKEEVIVAVIDTGVDYNHEDLRDVMWSNPAEIANNGIDDDNNGYIDDIHGIDTINKDDQGNASGDPMASHAHGTHVAGTIAASQNNGVGIAGIASNVKIMAIRAVPDSSDETDADVVESFLYAAKHGAKIINCSFGKAHNEGGMIVNETIDHIGQTYGALVIAAAGNEYRSDNDNKPKYPASFPSDYLLVVASTNKSGGLSWFSNVGQNTVDVAAPGSSVYSTVPGNGYSSMSGTSMASPTTAGVTAEVLSHFPELNPISLKKVIMESVTKVGRFEDLMVSGGRIDLYQALRHTLNNYDELVRNQSLKR
ncbi:MAG: S8 family serine peptidase [Bacteriovoracaceae bacterium]|nr:S8 family serine peptidase [Bacteriovoracaceae bacterium]